MQLMVILEGQLGFPGPAESFSVPLTDALRDFTLAGLCWGVWSGKIAPWENDLTLQFSKMNVFRILWGF